MFATIEVGVILEEEKYRYDKLFNIELVEYKTYTNGVLSKSMMEEYGYDSNGNIQTINKFENDNPTDEITTNYKWSYPDVMTGVHSTWNGDRISLTYTLSDRFKPDIITKNGVSNTLIWSENNLIQYGEYRYSYDSLGRRIRKEVGNVVRTYVYEGSKLIGETIKDNNVEVATLIYNYDQYGKLIGLSINEKEYIYIRDVLGNINGIIDQEGNVIVYYKCDVWGKLIDKDIKEDNLASRYNPFIYKGYYYDEETQLYWVSSRYYYPEIYRWISPDSIEYLEPQSINGLNLYCYCMNNPIMYIDPSGHFVISTFIGIIIVIGAVAATANDIYQIARDDGKGLKVSVSGDSVHIENSYKLLTPWMRYGYSFYLNHINPDTKDVIQGSTYGVQFEWELHNYAAWLGVGGEKAKHLDVGKSIFADGKDHPLIDKNGEISVFGIMSLGMRIYYMLYANRIDLIWDIIVNGGF